MADEKNNDRQKEDGEVLKDIADHMCGSRPCKCGEGGCEFAADFFDEEGAPTARFGEDDDLLEEQDLEAAEDYGDYAMRTGSDAPSASENGEIKYRNTAEYTMIDPSCGSADSGKS